MDAESAKLIREAVGEGIDSLRWSLLIVSVIAAGLGAFLGAYLKKKAEHLANKEGFNDILKQLKEQTRATERIKGEIAEKTASSTETLRANLAERLENAKATIQENIQRNLEDIRDSFERERSFNAFSRERIAGHLDRIIASNKQVAYLAELAGMRSWADSGDMLASTRTMYSELRSIEVDCAVLLKLHAIPQPIFDSVLQSSETVWIAWNNAMGELTRRDAAFRKQFPNEPEFSPKKYQERWEILLADVKKLQTAVLEITPAIVLPK